MESVIGGRIAFSRSRWMGASIVRGRDIALLSSLTAAGKEYLELVPVDGDYEFASYSTIAAAVSFCQERGIPADFWPIYYGFYAPDVPLDEVKKRCESLRLELAKFADNDFGQHWWLRRVWEWLSAGEIFCVEE
jgi:hypothetical protein